MSKSKKQEMLEDIRDYDQEIKKNEQKLKTLNEDLKEKIENTNAGETVAKLKDQLKIAQEDLIAELKRNPEVNNLMEEIGAVRQTINGIKFSLSNHLVAYFAQTQEHQVQMDDQGNSRDVILSAKLGKDEHLYQESIFNQENDNAK